MEQVIRVHVKGYKHRDFDRELYYSEYDNSDNFLYIRKIEDDDCIHAVFNNFDFYEVVNA